MPTVIDALIVTLDLDPAKFTKGQKEAGEAFLKTKEHSLKTAKEMEGAGKQAATFFTKIRNEVLGFAAALLSTRAIVDFTANMMRTGEAMGFLAANVGMSIPELSTWEGMMRQVGATSEEADSNLQNLNDTLVKWQQLGRPSNEVLSFLARQGVDTSRWTNALSTPHERILMIADAFKKLKPEAISTFASMIGVSRMFANMLAPGSVDVQARFDAQMKRNSWTDQDVETSKQLKGAWFEISEAMDKSERAIVNVFTPYLISIDKTLTNILGRLPEILQGTINSTTDTLEKIFPLKIGLEKPKGKFLADRLGITQAAESVHEALTAKSVQAFADRINRWSAYTSSHLTDYLPRHGKQVVPAAAVSGVAVNPWEQLIGMLNSQNVGAASMQNMLARFGREDEAGQARILNGIRRDIDSRNRLLNGASAGAAQMLQKTDIHIDNITVNTAATDAVGISKGLGSAIRQNLWAAKINPGLQ